MQSHFASVFRSIFIAFLLILAPKMKRKWLPNRMSSGRCFWVRFWTPAEVVWCFFLLTAAFVHFAFLMQIPVFSCAVLIGRLWKNALNIVADDIKNVLQSKKKSMENHTKIDPETLFFGDLVDDGCQIHFLVDFRWIWGSFPEPKWSQSPKKTDPKNEWFLGQAPNESGTQRHEQLGTPRLPGPPTYSHG